MAQGRQEGAELADDKSGAVPRRLSSATICGETEAEPFAPVRVLAFSAGSPPRRENRSS